MKKGKKHGTKCKRVVEICGKGIMGKEFYMWSSLFMFLNTDF